MVILSQLFAVLIPFKYPCTLPKFWCLNFKSADKAPLPRGSHAIWSQCYLKFKHMQFRHYTSPNFWCFNSKFAAKASLPRVHMPFTCYNVTWNPSISSSGNQQLCSHALITFSQWWHVSFLIDYIYAFFFLNYGIGI